MLAALDILPDLATRSVKTNESWKTEHDRKIDANEGLINIIDQVEYKFTGMEEKLGFECMKIVGNVTGSITGSTALGGQPVDYSGEIKNTLTYYFAHNEGIIIEVVNENTLNMNFNMTDLSIPMKNTGTTTITYVK